MILFFALVYPVIIRREEMFLRQQFGDRFDDYCARVPRFFPRSASYVEPGSWVVDTQRFRRTMMDVVWFVLLVAVIELLEDLKEHGIVVPSITLP